MNLPIIDLVFSIIIIALALIGFLKGFLDEVLGKVIPIASICVAFMTLNHILGPIEKQLKVHLFAVICSFLIVFIVCFLVLKIVQVVLKKIFSASILRSLDRFLGFAFGILEGVAVVCIILIVLTVQPWLDTDAILKGSIFMRLLGPVISIPKEIVEDSLNNASAFVLVQGAMNV